MSKARAGGWRNGVGALCRNFQRDSGERGGGGLGALNVNLGTDGGFEVIWQMGRRRRA